MSDEEKSLRDDLEAAFAEVDAPAEQPAPEPATVEAAEPETPAPVSEEKQTDDRPRDAQGKFVKQDDKPAEAAPAQAQPAEQPQEAAQEPVAAANAEPTPESMSGAKPPPSFSVAAKQAWASVPETVRNEIAKRETEIADGFKKFRDYKGLDEHIQFARRNGQELPQVIDNYIAAERMLQQDFVGGVRSLAQMYGVDVNQLAGALGGQPAPQPAQNGHDPQPAPQIDLSPVTSKISQLEQQIGQFQQQQENSTVQEAESIIRQFANDPKNVYFDNVQIEMGKLMKAGMADTIEQAYELACWNHPEIRSELIEKQSTERANEARQKEQEAASKARQAAQGLSSDIEAGSTPSPGSNGSLRDQLASAFDEAEGRI